MWMYTYTNYMHIYPYVAVTKDLAFQIFRPLTVVGLWGRNLSLIYIYITITKQLGGINMVILQAQNKQNAYNYKYYIPVYATHGSSIFATNVHLQQLPLVLKYYLFTYNTKKHHTWELISVSSEQKCVYHY